MDISVVRFVLGKLSRAYGLALLIPWAVALFYGETSLFAFTLAAAICFMLGHMLVHGGLPPLESLSVREGVAITALGWIMVTILGMIPYAAGGYLSVLDGLFETISGLSGTGATVFVDVEHLPQSLLLWRAMTHWLGGLGIIVIFIAVFPQFGRGIVHMFDAESTGPRSDRIVPRIKEMARALFYVYLLFTAVSAAIFFLCGMSPLIAIEHAFSTIATGGFSPYNDSAGHFHSAVVEGWLAFFMALSSANFGMYVAAWKRGIRVIFKDTEFRAYLGIVALATLLMSLNLIYQQNESPLLALRETLFQAVSVSSSTGYISCNFDAWPGFSKFILLFLMFVGGCAGSTTGGLKVTRLILLLKGVYGLVRRKIHPNLVFHLRSNGEEYSRDLLNGIARFFFVYLMLGVLWTAILVFDGVSIFNALTLSVSTMGSCGPGFGAYFASCATLPPLSKSALCLSMLMGRLEMFPVLAILMPEFWRHRNSW